MKEWHLVCLFFTVDIPQFCFFRTGAVQHIRIPLRFQKILSLLTTASPTAVCDQRGVLGHRVGWERHGLRIAVPHQVQPAGPDALPLLDERERY